MDLGKTATKLQRVTETAETVLDRLAALRDRVMAIEEQTKTTNERVTELSEELATQRAILEALADEQGIDTEAIIEQDDGTVADSGSDGQKQEDDA